MTLPPQPEPILHCRILHDVSRRHPAVRHPCCLATGGHRRCTSFDEGRHVDFEKRGILVHGPIADGLGADGLRDYMRLGLTVYKSER